MHFKLRFLMFDLSSAWKVCTTEQQSSASHDSVSRIPKPHDNPAVPRPSFMWIHSILWHSIFSTTAGSGCGEPTFIIDKIITTDRALLELYACGCQSGPWWPWFPYFYILFYGLYVHCVSLGNQECHIRSDSVSVSGSVSLVWMRKRAVEGVLVLTILALTYVFNFPLRTAESAHCVQQIYHVRTLCHKAENRG